MGAEDTGLSNQPPAAETQLHQCDGHGLGKADRCLVQLLPGQGGWKRNG